MPSLGSCHSCLSKGHRGSESEDYQSFVAACAKAAWVSDVPEEAIMSDTREPSYMFLAA